jgi:hypothetical protein
MLFGLIQVEAGIFTISHAIPETPKSQNKKNSHFIVLKLCRKFLFDCAPFLKVKLSLGLIKHHAMKMYG